MTATERRERFIEYCHHLTSESKMCINCRYYFLHYTSDGAAMNCGHCGYPRMKYRAPFEDCEHFENKYMFRKENKSC